MHSERFLFRSWRRGRGQARETNEEKTTAADNCTSRDCPLSNMTGQKSRREIISVVRWRRQSRRRQLILGRKLEKIITHSTPTIESRKKQTTSGRTCSALTVVVWMLALQSFNRTDVSMWVLTPPTHVSLLRSQSRQFVKSLEIVWNHIFSNVKPMSTYLYHYMYTVSDL